VLVCGYTFNMSPVRDNENSFNNINMKYRVEFDNINKIAPDTLNSVRVLSLTG